MTQDEAKPGRDYGIPIALGCVAAGGAAIGLAFPLLALNLDDWGVSEAGIGLFTLASALSTVVATPFIPPLLGRLSTKTVLSLSLTLIALAFAGYYLFPSIPAWLACRFVAGVAFSFLFVTCEAWALDRAAPERRGLIMGAFASTFAGALALGGAIIAVLGYTGVLPFLTGAAIAGLGLLLMLLPARALPTPEGEAARSTALLARIKAAPIVMLAPLAMGAIETAKYNLVPIYARRVGLSDEVAATMITASGIGVLVLQPLLGLIADRLGVKRTLALCAGAGTVLPLAIAAVGAMPWQALGLMFCYSGLVTGLYTIGIVWLGRQFSGADLASANAAFGLCYGAGQMVGPAIAGMAFGAFGPIGFMAALAAIAAVYGLALGLARTRTA